MPQQYNAVALQTTSWFPEKREDIQKNIDNLTGNFAYLFRCVDQMDLPIKLISLAEGALAGWTDTAIDDHVKSAKEIYNITIPGEETDRLASICKQYGTYLIAQMQATDPEFLGRDDRYFNMAFIIDPQGKIIHRHRKTNTWPRERVVCPTDVWDLYLEKFGKDPKSLLQAVFPVAKTEIGNIGTLICSEGSYPEPARCLALNGAEIIWRASYPEPFVGNEMFEIQNRSHAVFNTCYVIVPHLGAMYGAPWKIKDWKYSSPSMKSGSMIIDYRGQILSQTNSGGDSYASAILNVEGLRDIRVRSLWTNYLKDLRIEEYELFYMVAKELLHGIYPRNLCMTEPPLNQKENDDILRHIINKFVEHGVYEPPEGWQPHPVSKDLIEKVNRVLG